jgi:hypothetical protein
MIVTLQYTNTEPVLCRFLRYEHLAEGARVWVEDLRTGEKKPASEKFVQPYCEGKVVDLGREDVGN